VGIRRLLAVFVLVLAASVAVISDAPAGDIADEPCPDVAGPNTGTCPAGRVGVAYSLRFLLKEGSGCGPGKESWSVSSGSFPPGLTIASEGVVSGTPTQAGNFRFFLRVTHPDIPGECLGSWSDREVTIPILPEIPRLVLQPEQSGVPISTVGTSYALQMTANLADTKTWSIVEGTEALPPGLSIDATTGLISGTPTTAGSYSFTVQAVLTSDPRSDTKRLTVTVRDRVTITAPKLPPSEIGVPFEHVLVVAGGTGVDTYTWSVSGTLPQGVTFDQGTLSGTPRAAGRFVLAVTATDAEGRTATYQAVLNVAQKLAIGTTRLKAARVGRLYRAKLASLGGVNPKKWKLTGKLPRGVRFNKTLAVLNGKPLKAGRYRVTAELTDALQVKVTKTFTIVVVA